MKYDSYLLFTVLVNLYGFSFKIESFFFFNFTKILFLSYIVVFVSIVL